MGDGIDNLAEKLGSEVGEGGFGSGEGGNHFGDEKKDRNLQMILDIPLKVSVELGRTRMPVKELINLAQGSVVELNKLAGEPLEVYVNDKLIARGEAVVVNEKFGVRLTDIISQSERVEQLS
jgi:flagellar motor switch protein FliN/FliY